MGKNSSVLLLPLVGLLVWFSVTALAGRTDPLGSTGLPVEGIGILWHDSGCLLRACYGSCDRWDTGWNCWTTATYERFDGDWNGLPILVTSMADCTVFHIWRSSCSDCVSYVGSGRLTVHAQCWVQTIFAGLGMNSGWCSCQEL